MFHSMPILQNGIKLKMKNSTITLLFVSIFGLIVCRNTLAKEPTPSPFILYRFLNRLDGDPMCKSKKPRNQNLYEEDIKPYLRSVARCNCLNFWAQDDIGKLIKLFIILKGSADEELAFIFADIYTKNSKVIESEITKQKKEDQLFLGTDLGWGFLNKVLEEKFNKNKKCKILKEGALRYMQDKTLIEKVSKEQCE